MKLAVRVFVLGLFAAGASAAVVSSHSAKAVSAAGTITVSSQLMTPQAMMPACSPWGGCTPTTKSASSN